MNSGRDSIKQSVRNYILQEFLVGADPEELTDDTPLIEGGILDSLALIKLVTYLEEKFQIMLEVDVEQLGSIQSIVNTVEEKV